MDYFFFFINKKKEILLKKKKKKKGKIKKMAARLEEETVDDVKNEFGFTYKSCNHAYITPEAIYIDPDGYVSEIEGKIPPIYLLPSEHVIQSDWPHLFHVSHSEIRFSRYNSIEIDTSKPIKTVFYYDKNAHIFINVISSVEFFTPWMVPDNKKNRKDKINH